MKGEPYKRILAILRVGGANYEELEHEPVVTSAQAARVRGLSAATGAKSLLLKSDQGFVLAVLQGSKRLDSKKLRHYLGVSSVRFASADEVEKVMGCQIGACYPFGNICNLLTIVDTALSQQPRISFNPGLHHKSIKLAWVDYARLAKPVIVDIT